jgi:uncharacterized protein
MLGDWHGFAIVKSIAPKNDLILYLYLMNIIATYQNQINELCLKYEARTLNSFGSVNTTSFDSESDIDLVVDIRSEDPSEYAKNYFELKFQLEKLLSQPIDLLEKNAIRNPVFRGNIDNFKFLVYGC